MFAWLSRVGFALDSLLNVALLDGEIGETISEHAAMSAHAGKRWACVLCRALNVLVQRKHCDKVLSGQPTTGVPALRSFGLLILLCAAIAYAWGFAEGFVASLF
jgi:hypothetical protein